MKARGLLGDIFLLVLAICFFSCSDDDNTITITPNDYTQIVARGIIVEKDESFKKDSPNLDAPIIFTGKDIAWFNNNTREIRFKGIAPIELYPSYQKMNIELDSELLFSAATIATDIANFVCHDLVLYYDLENGRYFLLDAYPDFTAISKTAQENAKKRTDGWNKFLGQLKEEGRLKEQVK